MLAEQGGQAKARLPPSIPRNYPQVNEQKTAEMYAAAQISARNSAGSHDDDERLVSAVRHADEGQPNREDGNVLCDCSPKAGFLLPHRKVGNQHQNGGA